MTVAVFVVQFPEFGSVDEDQLQLHLDAAELEIDRDVWLEKGDQGQAYLAAHKLALSPFGNNARLVAEDGSTTYSIHYEKLQRQVSSGFRVC
jgi:hypothetical protein